MSLHLQHELYCCYLQIQYGLNTKI